MAEKRLYGQFCGLATGLDLVGERWTLLVVRELLPGPARFNDILANLPGIGPNLLAARLRTLVQAGIVEQRRSAVDGRGREYSLTPAGEELREPVIALARWGLRRLSALDPPHGGRGDVRASWSILAVEAMLHGNRPAAGTEESYEFRIGEVTFHIRATAGTAQVNRGPAPDAAIVVTTDTETFVEIGARLTSPLSAALSGALSIDGDQDALQRCITLMGLDEPTDGSAA